jgi:hypothetical protein
VVGASRSWFCCSGWGAGTRAGRCLVASPTAPGKRLATSTVGGVRQALLADTNADIHRRRTAERTYSLRPPAHSSDTHKPGFPCKDVAVSPACVELPACLDMHNLLLRDSVGWLMLLQATMRRVCSACCQRPTCTQHQASTQTYRYSVVVVGVQSGLGVVSAST